MATFSAVCVYCGSRPGSRPLYTDAVERTARVLVRQGITVVYGGASVGTMGQLADAALDAGGRVVGVIPKQLVEKEVAHPGLTVLHTVDSMHDRKALMSEQADAFIALPGGLGTLEELFEMWTWSQLGIHRKPIGLLNVDGYYDRLIDFLDHAVEEGFVRPAHRAHVFVGSDPETLVRTLRTEVLPHRTA
jgi:uncharacterized protein (TIGR00730 family)